MERVNSLSSSWNMASTSPVGKRSGGFFNSQRQMRAKPCCGPVLQAPNWAVGIKKNLLLLIKIFLHCKFMVQWQWTANYFIICHLGIHTKLSLLGQLTKNYWNPSSDGSLSIKNCLLAASKKWITLTSKRSWHSYVKLPHKLPKYIKK